MEILEVIISLFGESPSLGTFIGIVTFIGAIGLLAYFTL
jgi:hypothetical protein